MDLEFRRIRSALGILALCAAAGLPLLPAGIAKDPPSAPTRPKAYPVIKGAKVKLECISPHRVFTAGQDATLTFRLKNIGNKPVVVYEWFRAEGDNLVVHYAQEQDDPAQDPDDAAWLTIKPEAEFESPRMLLELAPGNAVLVSCPLLFVRALAQKDLAAPRSYLLYSELNLVSLSAKSPVIQITVQP
jgi:hypothetical protein